MTIAERRARTFSSGFTLTEIAVTLGIVGLVVAGIWEAAASVYEGNKVNQAVTEWLTMSSNLDQAFMAGQMNLPSSSSSSSLAIGSSGWYYAGIINTMAIQAGWAPPQMVNTSVSPSVLVNPWEGYTQTGSGSTAQTTQDGVLVTLGTLTPGGLTIPANDATAMAEYADQNCGDVENQSCIPTAAGNDAFEIAFNNIPVYACVSLAMMFGGAERPPEVVTIFIGMDNWVAGGGIGMGGTSHLPITLAQATTLCKETANPYGGTSSGGSSFIDIVYQP